MSNLTHSDGLFGCFGFVGLRDSESFDSFDHRGFHPHLSLMLIQCFLTFMISARFFLNLHMIIILMTVTIPIIMAVFMHVAVLDHSQSLDCYWQDSIPVEVEADATTHQRDNQDYHESTGGSVPALERFIVRIIVLLLFGQVVILYLDGMLFFEDLFDFTVKF